MIPVAELVQRIGDDLIDWCRGRWWWARVPILVWLGYLFMRHLSDGLYNSMFGAINLGIHEFGHYLWSPFGQFLAIAGGSLTQCLAPVASMVMFARQRDYFAIAFCFGWLSTNLFSVATYAADARAQQLQLVSPGAMPGDPIIHDWNWLLDDLGMLDSDQTIAFLLRAMATVSMLAALAGGGWMCWLMLILPLREEPTIRGSDLRRQVGRG